MKTTTVDSEGGGAGPSKIDRWLYWPAISTLIGVFCLVLLCGLPGLLSFILIPLVVLGRPLPVLAVVGLAGMMMVRRKPRKAASIILAVFPLLLWRPIQRATDYAHLGLTIGFGIGQLGYQQTSADNKFVVYDWSVGLAGGPNTFLIRDTTDQIALPLAQHGSPSADEKGFGEECDGRVQHLLKHYYVCSF
jgi:hypothetical protein